jgi:hypothetical protein
VTTPHESDGFHVSYAGETCVDIKTNAESLLQVTIIVRALLPSPSQFSLLGDYRVYMKGNLDRGMNIVLEKWRCHGENALEHDRTVTWMMME